MHKLRPTAHHGHTVAQCVADLRVSHISTAMIQSQPFAPDVVQDTVFQRQFCDRRGRTVTSYAIRSTMDIHVRKTVVHTRRPQPDASPAQNHLHDEPRRRHLQCGYCEKTPYQQTHGREPPDLRIGRFTQSRTHFYYVNISKYAHV